MGERRVSRRCLERCGQSPYSDAGFQRVRLKQNLNVKGWNSRVRREFPPRFESSNLSRDNLSRGVGRTVHKEDRDAVRSHAIHFSAAVGHMCLVPKPSCMAFT